MRYYLSLLILAGIACVRVFLFCGATFAFDKCLIPFSQSYSQDAPVKPSNILTTGRSQIYVYTTALVHKYFPSPHSELLLGMVLGVNDLKKVPSFEHALRVTGTIHVVVVSGFNINLIFGFLIKMLGSKYRLKNLVIAELLTLAYAFLSGFQPPVIRAWLMTTVFAWGMYSGRALDGLRVLLFSGLVMILFNPLTAFSLSFLLSFFATLGLIMYSAPLQKLFKHADLSATIAAQLAVWPLIAYSFGTFSLISFVVNPLILWTVSITTMLGCCFVLFAGISSYLAYVMALVIFPFLDFFIRLIDFFSSFQLASVPLSISRGLLIGYYLLLLTIWKWRYYNK